MRISQLLLTLLSILTSIVAGCASASTTNDAGAPARIDAGPPPVTAVDAGPPADPVCGDLVCTPEVEDCESCELDCGECPTCDLAPTCTGAVAAPTSTEPFDDCGNRQDGDDRTNYACGLDVMTPASETTCTDPQLRMRIRQIEIRRGFFDVSRHIYCVISAEDGAHSELLVTPPRSVAGNQDETTINLALSDGVFWGQADLYRSVNNVTVTYSCFLTSDVEGAMAVLDEIADRAGDSAEYAGEYGWVFGAVSVAGGLISSALGATSDKQILDVQQTIDRGALLELTNGRTWDIRSEDGNLSLSGAHRLNLEIEAWGCAMARTTFD